MRTRTVHSHFIVIVRHNRATNIALRQPRGKLLQVFRESIHVMKIISPVLGANLRASIHLRSRLYKKDGKADHILRCERPVSVKNS